MGSSRPPQRPHAGQARGLPGQGLACGAPPARLSTSGMGALHSAPERGREAGSVLAVDRFEDVPAHARVEVFGVPYVRLECPAGHELFLTGHGWPWREHLLPERWYEDAAYARRGTRLTRSTGTVYRDRTEWRGRALETVVKISRVAPHLERGQLLRVPEGAVARFSSPFEEFAAVERLRRSRRGPPIVTKRPLAILCSARPYQGWELGRDPGDLAWHAARLERDQAARAGQVRLEPARDYLVVFQWIDGETLLDLRAAGAIDDVAVREITVEVIADLERHGLRVLDHKPDHVVVRRRPDGALPRRRGRLVYALTDYELLVEAAEEEGRARRAG